MGRLFWKIFLAFSLALVAAAAGTGTAVWLQRHARVASEHELAVGPPHMLATGMAASTLRYGGVDALRQWMSEVNHRRPLPLYVVDGAGNELLGRPVPEAVLARARTVAAEPDDGRAARRVAAPGGESYLLFVPLSADPRLHRPPPPPSPWLVVFMAALTCLAVSALLAWYLARPIRNLRWAFDAAANGRLDTRVLPLMGRRRDEIADLGRDFDRMAQRLQALVSAQARLLHDVSHELRSPLARLQAAIGLMRQSPEKSIASLDRIEREATRLDELIGQALTLARLEARTVSSGLESVDFADLVANVAEDARFEAEASGRRVSLTEAGDMPMVGHPELLQRAVENVVRNAVKYTREGTSVDIELRAATDPASAVLTVSDQGPGIPAGDLEKVFEPFYRGSPAPSANGFGLGLAIAQRAVEAHGGTIRAANVPGGGLRVEIRLPLAKAR